MSEAYVGEIRMFGGDFAPVNWVFCNGQLLNISEHQMLYSLLLVRYGGDGITTFGVPDLRGRIPLHVYATYTLGSHGGSETTVLDAQHVPPHAHALMATATPANTTAPGAEVMLAQTATNQLWTNDGGVSNTFMARIGIGKSETGGAKIDTVASSFVINFILCTEGIFPPHG